jgi:hypothetical protein
VAAASNSWLPLSGSTWASKLGRRLRLSAALNTPGVDDQSHEPIGAKNASSVTERSSINNASAEPRIGAVANWCSSRSCGNKLVPCGTSCSRRAASLITTP